MHNFNFKWYNTFLYLFYNSDRIKAPLRRQAVLRVQVQEVVHGDHDHVIREDERTILLRGDGVHSNEKEDLCKSKIVD